MAVEARGWRCSHPDIAGSDPSLGAYTARKVAALCLSSMPSCSWGGRRAVG
jgi:hypothetical protein